MILKKKTSLNKTVQYGSYAMCNPPLSCDDSPKITILRSYPTPITTDFITAIAQTLHADSYTNTEKKPPIYIFRGGIGLDRYALCNDTDTLPKSDFIYPKIHSLKSGIEFKLSTSGKINFKKNNQENGSKND